MNECMNPKLREELWTGDAFRSYHIVTGLKIMTWNADTGKQSGGGGVEGTFQSPNASQHSETGWRRKSQQGNETECSEKVYCG